MYSGAGAGNVGIVKPPLQRIFSKIFREKLASEVSIGVDYEITLKMIKTSPYWLWSDVKIVKVAADVKDTTFW